MANEEAEFSANSLFLHRNNPGQSSHESTDSGCYDAEALLSGCQKTFDSFCHVSISSQAHHHRSQNPNLFSLTKNNGPTKQRASGRKEENTPSDNSKEGALSESGGPSYKYLTWREKDRRRRFREEWKHLWLVIPHGMYEVIFTCAAYYFFSPNIITKEDRNLNSFHTESHSGRQMASTAVVETICEEN